MIFLNHHQEKQKVTQGFIAKGWQTGRNNQLEETKLTSTIYLVWDIVSFPDHLKALTYNISYTGGVGEFHVRIRLLVSWGEKNNITRTWKLWFEFLFVLKCPMSQRTEWESSVVLSPNTQGSLKRATQRRDGDCGSISFANDCNLFSSHKQPVLRRGSRVTLSNLIRTSSAVMGTDLPCNPN